MADGGGKLLTGKGKARYIDSGLWRDLGEDVMLDVSEDEDEDKAGDRRDSRLGYGPWTEDMLSSALLGLSTDLIDYHPTHIEAMKLWSVHLQNVEPLCKILHAPTTTKMVKKASERPTAASKATQCLLFAIYHFAIFSMTDEDCVAEFAQSRSALMARYQYAVRQALVQASWLKTTDVKVVQALVLFLTALRTQIDPHTYWIMTGVAVRLAQRLGLHRDGDILGLPPFDVEMRRRLFWQLLPLDGWSGQVSGTGISIAPNSWDTRRPLNVNDDQLYPGMTEPPEEQKGPTDMIYFLVKAELSSLYTRTGVKMQDLGATLQLRDAAELNKLIDEVEDEIEMKYLRHCDVIDPLHFLTFGVMRSAINTVRLRSRMPQFMGHGGGGGGGEAMDERERRQLCALAHKVLDTDSAAYSHPKMKRFHWTFRGFFLWDAVICVTTSLARIGFFSPAELDESWSRIADVYANHAEILEAKRALHVAVGRVTLKAWTINPPPSNSDNSVPEPAFITTLRSQRKTRVGNKLPKKIGALMSNKDLVGPLGPSGSSIGDSETVLGSFGTPDTSSLDGTFNFDTADWMFWDQLIRDYETVSEQQTLVYPIPQQAGISID